MIVKLVFYIDNQDPRMDMMIFIKNLPGSDNDGTAGSICLLERFMKGAVASLATSYDENKPATDS